MIEQLAMFEATARFLRVESCKAFLDWQEAPFWRRKKAWRHVQEIARRASHLGREYRRFLETHDRA